VSIQKIERVSGAMVPLRGNDIDTDRIIPARFLRAISFEGLEAHLFEDDRQQTADPLHPHAFGNPAYAGASVLLVNRNFGCGSSREHAPQAIKRWGISAVLGESFSEIFFGNSLAIGLPCATISGEDAAWLMDLAESAPTTSVEIDLVDLTLTAADRVIPLTMPRSAQEAVVSGSWDATGLLLQNPEEVQSVAARLPYTGW
jgi:3-isopropylmalate/(R)-2-methylmalate dehydratase small subunit